MAFKPGKKTSLRRFRYAVDNAMSRGVWVVLVWLGLALFVLVIILSSLMWLTGIGPQDSDIPFVESVWINLTRSLDPGTFGTDEGHRFRFLTLVVTLIGVLAVAVIIGLVSSAIDRRLDLVRRGRSVVAESDHTLIIGESGKLSIILRELVEAQASEGRTTVVVMTESDKVELEERLHREVPSMGNTRLVVRRGDPASLHDLDQVQPRTARAVIILREDGDSGDAESVKASLAVVKSREGLEYIPLVVELESAETARALRQALPGQVMTIVAPEVVARVAAQTSRSAGLGVVYRELLDFSGDEFYIADAPDAFIGKRFGSVLTASMKNSIVGLLSAQGDAELCPSFERVITRGDRIVVIAEDDSSVAFNSNLNDEFSTEVSEATWMRPRVERTLILGWNETSERMISEIDRHVAPNSSLHVVAEAGQARFSESQPAQLLNQLVTWEFGNLIDREVIRRALIFGPFDHILILCSHDGVPTRQADSRALLTLMHVRNLLDSGEVPSHLDGNTSNLVTEVLDSDSVDLAMVARPDDFIVSQHVVSLLIAQLIQEPRLKPVLYDLLDSQGSQVLMVKASDMGIVGEWSYLQVVEKARDFGLIAIGYTPFDPDSNQNTGDSGVCVNPPKVHTRTFESNDSVIALRRFSA